MSNLLTGDRIKEMRKKLGLSQQKFSEVFGVPMQSLRNWELEKRKPNRSTQLYFLMIDRFPQEAAAIAAGVIEDTDETRHVYIGTDEVKKIVNVLNTRAP